jgi:hypothetical protein
MARKHKPRAYPPDRAFRNHTVPPDAMLAAAPAESMLATETQNPEEEIDDLYEEAEETIEEQEVSDPPLQEIARIELTDPSAITTLTGIADSPQTPDMAPAVLPKESEVANLAEVLPVAAVKVNGLSPASSIAPPPLATIKTNGMPPVSSPAVKANGASTPSAPVTSPTTAKVNGVPIAASASAKADGATHTPALSPVAPPPKTNGASLISSASPSSEAKPAPSVPAREPVAVGAAAKATTAPAEAPKPESRLSPFSSELFVWFVGAIAIGATLGAIIVLLILSGINGSLFYTTATRGVQIEREQSRVSEQLTAISRDMTELQSQMIEMNKLPNQVEALNKNMDAAQKTLGNLTQSLESMDRSVKSHTESLGSMNSDMATAKTTLQELNQQMAKVSTDLETVRGSAKQFDGFLGGLQSLVGNLISKK